MIPGGRKGRRIPLFFTVGWLFAELLLGIAMVFLIASPGATIPPGPTPTPTSTPTPVTPTIPVPTPTLHPYLSTSPVTIEISGVDVQGLIANNSTAVANFKQQVINKLAVTSFQDRPLSGQCAGLVIPYGREPDLGGNSIAIGTAVTKVLAALGQSASQGAFFKLAVYHDPLIWVDPAGYGTVRLELYIFIGSASCHG